VRVLDLATAILFYGRQPKPEEVSQITAPLVIQNAGLDKRIGAGAPAYEAALMSNNNEFATHNYTGLDPRFNNDTTPLYDVPAVELAWQRTIVFFKQKLA
tara:strand:- start:69 stop:368 length:300 start_codon:yes stop_codon:yes gene_type:complete